MKSIHINLSAIRFRERNNSADIYRIKHKKRRIIKNSTKRNNSKSFTLKENKDDQKYRPISLNKVKMIEQSYSTGLISILKKNSIDYDIISLRSKKRRNNSVHFAKNRKDLVTVHQVENWKEFNTLEDQYKDNDCDCNVGKNLCQACRIF